MKIKSTERRLPHNKLKEDGLIICDAITNISRQSSIKVIIEYYIS
jgi:hypothetical protein